MFGKAYKVPITNDLLKLARTAQRSHQAYLDEQKRLEEEKKKKKKSKWRHGEKKKNC